MVDRFPQMATERHHPATGAVAVSPDDNEELDTTRALYVGSTGNLKVDMGAGGAVTFSNVPDGTILPICVTKVYNSDTTASDILALY